MSTQELGASGAWRDVNVRSKTGGPKGPDWHTARYLAIGVLAVNSGLAALSVTATFQKQSLHNVPATVLQLTATGLALRNLRRTLRASGEAKPKFSFNASGRASLGTLALGAMGNVIAPPISADATSSLLFAIAAMRCRDYIFPKDGGSGPSV